MPSKMIRTTMKRRRSGLAAAMLAGIFCLGTGACGSEMGCFSDCLDDVPGVQVRVVAYKPGVDTGFPVAAGDQIKATACDCDRWSSGSGGWANAGGVKTSPVFDSKVPGAPMSSLIGWVSGCPEKAFLIGLGATIKASCSGTLWLACNDNWDSPGCVNAYGKEGCHYDNVGAVRVALSR